MTDQDWSSSDFDWIDWDAVAPRGTADCRRIAQVVTTLQAATAETETRRRASLEILLDLLCIHITWHPKASSPLTPDRIIARIPQSALTALVAQLPRIASAELRARILDVAWLRRACSHIEATTAVEAYLEDFAVRFDAKSWPACFARVQRAVDLGASLSRTSDAHRRALDIVEAKLDELDGTDPLYLSARLMELLLKYQRGDAAVYAALCAKIAEGAQAKSDFDRAVTYLEIEVRWWNLAKKGPQASDARLRIARTLEAKALAHEPRMQAAFLLDAIEAYRQHPNGKADADRLRVQLQATQREAMQNMPRHEFSADVSECVVRARAEVAAKTPFDALVALCSLHRFLPLDEVHSAVRTQLKETPFSAFLPQVHLSPAGRVVHQSDAVTEGSDAFVDAMRRHVVFQQNFTVQAAILPAVETVRLEHGLRFEDFAHLATRSPFVPANREMSFARGLTAGFYGDFDVAVHLLVPQLENAIRRLLEQAGAITTTLSSTGTQKEKDLNQLLSEPLATTVFGEALLFELQTLLTEKPGTNLRNEIAHGLIDDGARVAFVYCWWIALRLVLTPLANAVAVPSGGSASGPGDAAGSGSNTSDENWRGA